MRLKKLAAAVAVVVPVSTALVATTPSADASVIEHDAAQAGAAHCAGTMCMVVEKIQGNVATIDFETNPAHGTSVSFSGHWQLQAPNGSSWNSPNKFNSEYSLYAFANKNGGSGTWCGTQWLRGSGNYYSRGAYFCINA